MEQIKRIGLSKVSICLSLSRFSLSEGGRLLKSKDLHLFISSITYRGSIKAKRLSLLPAMIIHGAIRPSTKGHWRDRNDLLSFLRSKHYKRASYK
jgi:hypothetical protein